jgi:RNA polymerase sigma-70 factor (ECF subfamily)
MAPLSDEDLIARYQAEIGSPEADRYLEELFERYRTKVALWCLRLSKDRESAADLAQEVFLKVFRALSTFRGDAKFSTWLYSIARNHCFNELKSRATAPEASVDPALFDAPDNAPSPLARLETESSARMLREWMATSLTAVETQVLSLHYVDELSLEQVTRLLSLENASGAKAYIVSAKRKLIRAAGRWKARSQEARS